MKKSLALLVVLAALSAVLPAGSLEAQSRGAQTRQPRLERKGPSAIPGQYIVVLRDGDIDPGDYASVLARAQEVTRGHGVVLDQVYAKAVRGFAGRMSEAAAIAISQDPRVESVEEDAVMEAGATQSPATWGIDRIDQRNLPLSNSYSYTATGAGVTAYVIDTGIVITHNEFDGLSQNRASIGFDSVSDGQNGNDCNGHGTHVAGTIGGTTYGVAKGVTLVAVRVLNCSGSGSTSGVIAGVDWVTTQHLPGAPAVANMSLGGSQSPALDAAVRNSVADGVTYVVSAGNSNADANRFSPARVAEAITVGATTSTDARASYSNHGSVVDLFAPGSSITSAWRTSDTATASLSGTSMAAPHVAGVVARYLQGNSGASPAAVSAAVVAAATTGKVTNLKGKAAAQTPNRLLYWLD